MGERPIFQRVPKPVDVSDEKAFPEIARALEHARRIRTKDQDNEQ